MADTRRTVVVANRRDGGWWWRLPILAAMWLAIAVPIVVALVVAHTLRAWSRDLPAVPDLAAWRAHAPQTSYIDAADGSRLAELPFRDGATIGHRTLLPIDALPPLLVKAVLAAEDVRFASHHGVDYAAIARAAYLNYKAGRTVEGASTITQQVARNLLPAEIGFARDMKRKVREALLAREIEKRWTKREILDTYLNFVYLGQGAYGVGAAARAYFDRSAADLDLAQAALLAGLVQAPGRLDPFHHPEAARARRDEILARMLRAKLIDEPTRAAAAATPIALHRPRPAYGARVPWYTEQVRQQIAGELPDELARGGLTIRTAALPALGTELQARAVAHAAAWGDPEVGALLWDHHTGYVEALVGGRVWSPVLNEFDRMRQSCRQPGSAWKPIVYGAGLQSGAITPGTALRDAPVSEYDEATNVHWKPKSGNRFRGVVLVQDAFAASLNAPAIDVFDRTGADAIVRFARSLGITTAIAEQRPMALGASCVHPIELARAYAAIARGGWAITPRFAVGAWRGDEVLRDASVPDDPQLSAAARFDRLAAVGGETPDVYASANGGQLIDAPTAFQLQRLMAGVVAHGTAAVAGATLGRPAAGKTGTTNDNTDAWFVGFTARELGAVWTGFDDPKHKLGPTGDGAHAALPLWIAAIRMAEGARAPGPLPPPPPGMEQHAIDPESGLLAAPGRGGEDVWFRKGTAPTETAGAPGTSAADYTQSTREF